MNALSEFVVYPFDTDEAYQQGLASMSANGAIDPHAPPEAQEETILRTKVFYFNRVTGKSITVEQVKNHVHEVSKVTEHSISADEAQSRILTFAELQELIQSGKVDQIPNNKVIPDELNECPPSESKTVPRKKPWELTSVELANNVATP